MRYTKISDMKLQLSGSFNTVTYFEFGLLSLAQTEKVFISLYFMKQAKLVYGLGQFVLK